MEEIKYLFSHLEGGVEFVNEWVTFFFYIWRQISPLFPIEADLNQIPQNNYADSSLLRVLSIFRGDITCTLLPDDLYAI